MPLPRALALFNRHVTNKFVGPLAKVVPMLAVIHHVGRRSGNEYRTPVNAFRHDDGYVIPLTYGRNTDWVKNVLAAGGCQLETHGRIMEMTDPALLPTQEGLAAMPALAHLILEQIHVDDFLFLRIVEQI